MASSLSDTIDNVLGDPYADGGRGPKGWDCFGLGLWLMRATLGVELPDPGRDAKAITEFAESFERVEPPWEPLDWLHVVGSHRQHVAIVEDDEWAVEAVEGVGVVRTPLSDFDGQQVRGYRFRWQ